VEKVAKYARNLMSLEQKLDVLDRLACGESCAFVCLFVLMSQSLQRCENADSFTATVASG
jgi:hypothetical protein